MAKFKTGDRVRNLEATDWIKKGATGTVDEDGSETPYVIWDSLEMLTENGQCKDRTLARGEDHLELTEDEKPNHVPDSGKLVEMLTKREQFATAAMQGICAHPDTWGYPNIESVAGGAVKIADALIAELSKPTNP